MIYAHETEIYTPLRTHLLASVPTSTPSQCAYKCSTANCTPVNLHQPWNDPAKLIPNIDMLFLMPNPRTCNYRFELCSKSYPSRSDSNLENAFEGISWPDSENPASLVHCQSPRPRVRYGPRALPLRHAAVPDLFVIGIKSISPPRTEVAKTEIALYHHCLDRLPRCLTHLSKCP